MSRGDEPAYPVTLKELCEIFKDAPPILADVEYRGLTKREEFAKAAMQGIIASLSAPGANPIPKLTAEFAVEMADALLAQLAKEQPK